MYFAQISAVCIDVCIYMQATFLVVEIADRFLGQVLKGYYFITDIELLKQILFCLTWKRGFASIMIIIV